jgi:hypothetical protein
MATGAVVLVGFTWVLWKILGGGGGGGAAAVSGKAPVVAKEAKRKE